MQLPVETQSADRLIVIIPACLAGDRELSHKIFWMATREQCEVTYLTLVDHEEKLFSTNLAMIGMKAVTASNCLTVRYELTKTSLWEKSLREIYQKGDRIVCQQEQHVRTGVFTTIPLSEYLRDVLGMTTMTTEGFYLPQKVLIRHWRQGLIAWAGFLLILVGFTALEIRMDGQTHGMLNKVILAALFTIEVGAIWAWNAMIG